MHNVIIVGAGIASLSVAIRLRVAGYQVDVYEQNECAGGKLSEVRLDQFRFDAGPSLFTMPQYVEELFSIANQETKGYFEYSKKETICNYFFADNQFFSAKANRDDFINDMSQTFNTPKSDIERYMLNSQKKYDLTSTLFLEKSLHKIKTYFSFDTIKAIINIPSLHLNLTLDKVNKSYFKSKNLVQFFNRYATYNGSSPYLTPGIMSLIPHLEQHYCTYFPKDGMISISKSLVNLAEKLGVNFHYNSLVERIEIKNKKATGIRINNRLVKADIVISNMDIVPTYRKLLSEHKAPVKTLSQDRSSSALIFYWGIQGSFPELDLHNIFFSENYESEFKTIFEDKNIADDITVYLNISSKEKPNDAPAGCENWFVLVNAPYNSGQNWDEIIARTRKNVITKLANHLKKDIQQLIVCEEIVDPRKIESKTSSFQGSLYGAASNSKFSAFLRHPNFSKQIKNLYFCGGSVHPGGGIPLCLLSGKITSEIIVHDQPITTT